MLCVAARQLASASDPNSGLVKISQKGHTKKNHLMLFLFRKTRQKAKVQTHLTQA
jgi:hypothetical protein